MAWTRDEETLRLREERASQKRKAKTVDNLARAKRERKRRKMYAELYEPHQCVRELPNGEQCVKFAIPGGWFCILHGGDERSAREAAKMRLLAMVDPAFRVMLKAMASEDMNVALKAAIAVADRAGYYPRADLDAAERPEDLSKLTQDELAERAQRTLRRLNELKMQEQAERDAAAFSLPEGVEEDPQGVLAKTNADKESVH